MEHESPFLISSPEQIIYYLSILFKHKCLLTVYFGDKDDSFITTILDIYIKDNLLAFYHSPKKESIEQLLNSPVITFKTRCFGVEVIFEAMRLDKINYHGLPAFAVPIPESMLWMERRAFYRVKLPAAKSSYCQLTLKDQEPINYKLYDISIIGFSMLVASQKVPDLSKESDPMVLYTSFEQCKLMLADVEADTVSFEIRSKYIINPETSKRMEKIGCQFTQITPAFQSAIQRYMQQIERESQKRKHWV